MSTKRKDPPPTASSSDEEESETQSSSSAKEDVPVVALAAATEKKASDSESGSDSGSGSGSDEDDSEPKKNNEVVTKPPLNDGEDSGDSDESPVNDAESGSDAESEKGDKEDEVVPVSESRDSRVLKKTETQSSSSAKEDVPVVALSAATEKKASDSESGSGSGSGSGSDEEDSEPNKNNEVVTKPPLNDSEESGDSDESPVNDAESEKGDKEDELGPVVKSSVAKRSRETEDVVVSMNVKRVKKVLLREEEKKAGSGASFQRLWTDNDEISLLQGLLDHRNHNVSGVYELMKNDFSFDVSKVQFREKIRHLKKKYENNFAKSNPTFVRAHDCKVFKLSKLVWGAMGESDVKESNEKSSVKKSSGKSKNVESFSLVRVLVCFGVDEFVAQQGVSGLSSKDKKMFEEQWRALQVKKLDFYLDFYVQKTVFLNQMLTKMAQNL